MFSPAACDSVSVAGMFELLRTQGLWAESLRFAWALVVARTFEEAFGAGEGGGTAPRGPPTWPH